MVLISCHDLMADVRPCRHIFPFSGVSRPILLGTGYWPARRGRAALPYWGGGE